MPVLEDDESAIIIDVGMSFPDETMHGVDILVPDFSYLHAIKSKIKGILITHAHEDHIGAVPYLFKELKFPIYGTPLSLAMIEAKFQEHKLRDDYQNYFLNFIFLVLGKEGRLNYWKEFWATIFKGVWKVWDLAWLEPQSFQVLFRNLPFGGGTLAISQETKGAGKPWVYFPLIGQDFLRN